MDYVLKTNILKIAGFLIIICAMLYTVNLKPSNNNQIKDAVLYILNKKKENTKIIVTPDWTDLTIMYYYNRSIFADYTHLYQNMKKENLFPTNDIETVKALIQNKDSDIIYTDMGSKFVDKENKIYELLKSSFPQKEDKLFKGVKIIHFYY